MAHDTLDIFDGSSRRATRLDRAHLKEARRRSGAITDKRNQTDDRNHADPERERHVTQQRLETRRDRFIPAALGGTLAHRRATLTHTAAITNLLSYDLLSQGSLLLSTLIRVICVHLRLRSPE